MDKNLKNVFLLYWNPFFSSYKMEYCLKEFDFGRKGLKMLKAVDEDAYASFMKRADVIEDVLTEEDAYFKNNDDFNWSVYEWEKAKAGDRFFFIKTGYEKPTGLVGSGYFISDPYEGEDWSGQGRKTFYMDMKFDVIINPTSSKVLATETLTDKIPEIVWNKGKAGTLILPETAAKIEKVWKEHIESLL